MHLWKMTIYVFNHCHCMTWYEDGLLWVSRSSPVLKINYRFEILKHLRHKPKPTSEQCRVGHWLSSWLFCMLNHVTPLWWIHLLVLLHYGCLPVLRFVLQSAGQQVTQAFLWWRRCRRKDFLSLWAPGWQLSLSRCSVDTKLAIDLMIIFLVRVRV